jgi:hypothetical protein
VTLAVAGLARQDAPALVLNVPSRLELAMGAQSIPILPNPLPENLRVFQMLDGPHGPPGTRNGFAAIYGPEIERQTLSTVKTRLRAFRTVSLMVSDAGAWQMRLIAENPTPPAGRDGGITFMRGDAQVVLHSASACRYAGDMVRVSLTMTVANGTPTTAKFFRQVFQADEKVGGNDDELASGYLSLAELGPKPLTDHAYIRTANTADAFSVGIYDWQTGERWETSPGQPENAVKLMVQPTCP